MSYQNLGPTAFKAAIETTNNAVIIDVRTPAEVAEGIIDGAVVIDFMAADFPQKVAALDRSVPYYVYCRSGNRSGQACQLMAQLGFGELTNLDGGMLAWNA